LIRLKVPGQSLIMIRRLAEAAYANAYLLLTLVSLFWAGNQIVGRAAAGEIPPITLGCLRWLVATGLLLPFAWSSLKADWRVIRNNVWLLAFLGVIGGGAINTFSYIGLNYTTATNGVVLNSFIPVMIIAMAWAFFGERLTRVQLLGVAVSLVGVLAILSGGSLATLARFRLNAGDLCVILAMAMWSLYTVLLRRRPLGLDRLSFLFVLAIVGVVIMLPLWLGETLLIRSPVWSARAFAALIGVAIFSSVLAYIFWNRGVELLGPAVAGLFVHLMPVFGALLAWLFLGERLEAYHLAGMALILTGIAVTSRAGRAVVPAGTD
jgi:drug/metabolite transporter (DMT)-like permease